MHLGVQYYRAPFPDRQYWEEDFAKIADSGLDTVQVWILWSWVEHQPGSFEWSEYDGLFELADKHSLKVVPSLCAELQPSWILREVPGSDLVNRLGHKVVTGNRNEAHQGLTPAGCTDHPEVWERMTVFLRAAVERYRSAESLLGWDAWNELRWNMHANERVCYCERTIAAWRQWLENLHGDLDGLNRAWNRRYAAWEDVWPGIGPRRPYTETMWFDRFLTWRANDHGRKRYEIVKKADPEHLVTLHAADPSPIAHGGGYDQPINRGNDWFFADDLDGIGTSSFPKWQGIDDAGFGLRVECVKSAARDKEVWLSEIQGGRASSGFEVFERVDPPSQQRWIWNGLACGARTFLFWCWRDEVFGYESSGFGLSGADGWADARLDAMRHTGKLLHEHEEVFDNYQPDGARVGVFFSPMTYYLHDAEEEHAQRAAYALEGYARALVRCSIPYRFIEEEHLDELEKIDVLFMPRVLVTSPEVEERLEAWVQNGGALFIESECGAFQPNGLYRYPQDRFTSRLVGGREIGRRELDENCIQIRADGDRVLRPGATQWLTPWDVPDAEVLARHEDGALLARKRVGKGSVSVCGTYLGESYFKNWTEDFERLVEEATQEGGVHPPIQVVSPRPGRDGFVYVKSGISGGRRIIFVFAPEECPEITLRLEPGFLKAKGLTDIIDGETLRTAREADGADRITLRPSRWNLSVLLED